MKEEHKPADRQGKDRRAPAPQPGHSRHDKKVHDTHMPGPEDQPQEGAPDYRKGEAEGDERVNPPSRK